MDSSLAVATASDSSRGGPWLACSEVIWKDSFQCSALPSSLSRPHLTGAGDVFLCIIVLPSAVVIVWCKGWAGRASSVYVGIFYSLAPASVIGSTCVPEPGSGGCFVSAPTFLLLILVADDFSSSVQSPEQGLVDFSK